MQAIIKTQIKLFPVSDAIILLLQGKKEDLNTTNILMYEWWFPNKIDHSKTYNLTRDFPHRNNLDSMGCMKGI